MKKNKIIIVVSIIIILLSIAVFKKYYTESKWKTYINEEYSFSVQYPEEYTPEYSSDKEEISFHMTKDGAQIYQTPINFYISKTASYDHDKINTIEFYKDTSIERVTSRIYKEKYTFGFICQRIDVGICEKILKSAKYEIDQIK